MIIGLGTELTLNCHELKNIKLLDCTKYSQNNNSAFRSSTDIRIMSKSCLHNNFMLHGKKKSELLAIYLLAPHTYPTYSSVRQLAERPNHVTTGKFDCKQ